MYYKTTTYNFIIPSYGRTEPIERAAEAMAMRLFAAHGKWAIKSSDAFVTLFFSCVEDRLTFHSSWFRQAAASPFVNLSQIPWYSVQEHMVSSEATQPAVIPDVAMAPITEYLRVGPRGGMDRDWAYDYEFYSPETFNSAVRTDPRSWFTSAAEMGCLISVQWNVASVIHEGLGRTMLWTRESNRGKYFRNETAIDLLRHHFVNGSGLASPDDEVIGNVYFLMSETWKPFIDIPTTNIERASDFREATKGIFKGWWHATSIENGWRVFSDSLTELTYAKLALSS